MTATGLTAKQRDFMHAEWRRINILEGAVRSGKTHVLNYIAPYLACNGPQGKGAIIAKTLETLRENILDPMKELLGGSMSYADSGRRITIEGHRIRGVGANDEKSKSKIHGDTLAWAIGDEVVLWPESFFNTLLGRLSKTGAKFFGSCNPEGPYHWLKTGFIDRAGELDLTATKFRIEDNTYLDPDYVSALKKEYAGTVWYKRYILGEWAMADGLIYDMFDESRHVRDDIDVSGWDAITGIDYGIGNPTTWARIYTDGHRAHVAEEYYYSSGATGRQKTDEEFVTDFRKFFGTQIIRGAYIDPSAASLRLSLQRDGWPVRDANNEVIEGIRFTSSLLNSGRLTYSSSCRSRLREYASYSWDPTAQKRGEDKPIKQHDHGLDADRYALYTHLGLGGPVKYQSATRRRSTGKGVY